MKFLNFFIDKTKLVNMLTIGLLLAGIIAVSNINREASPKVDFDTVFVITIYPGAAMEDVELDVTIPLEDEINNVDGIKTMVSTTREGYSQIRVEIDPDVDDVKYVKKEIQKAVDRVNDLPDEVTERPYIWELKTDNFEILQVSLSSDSVSENELRAYGRMLKKKLERLSYVGNCNTIGFRQREIQIRVDMDKLHKNYMSLNDVIQAVQVRNVRIPAGSIRGLTEAKSVVTKAKFMNLDEIESMILRTNFEGERVVIKDIAEVVDDFQEYRDLTKMNGNIGVAISAHKKSNADIIRTIDQVKEAVEDFKKEAGNKIQIHYVNDSSMGTRTMLRIVTNNALLGMILVLAMLLIFLNFKTAMWTALGIPLSLCITLFLMVIFDMSINSNSLLGMVIVLGMLVDDAIVVAESIYRHRLEGYSPKEAAKKGLRVVALPVLVTVITTILAFGPLIFLPGIMGKFAVVIPLVIIYTLLGSLVECYFILPNHLISHAIRKETNIEGNDGKIITAPEEVKEKLGERKWFVKLQEKYISRLEIALDHRFILIGIFVFLFIATITVALVFMKFELFPQTTIEQVSFYFEAEKGTPLFKTEKLTRKIEKILLNQPDGVVDSFSTKIARGMYDVPRSENFATLTVFFPPAALQIKDPGGVIDEIKKAALYMPEIKKTSVRIGRRGPPLGADIEINIIGNENKKRGELVEKTVGFLKEISGTYDVESSEVSGKPELVMNFDYEKLARYGLTAASVGMTVRTALEGTIVSRSYTPDERIDYRVLLQKKYRQEEETLKKLYVTNSSRNLVPITDVVKISENETLAQIKHYNGDRVTQISANLNKEKITPLEVNQKIIPFLKQLIKENPGYYYELGGEAKETQEFLFNITISFLIAILAIYFILSLLFDSFLQPFIVMITIPFGVVGVVWTFVIHGLSFSFLTFIGLVGLSGIVVNDSLIMVDYINTLVKEKNCRTIKQYQEVIIEGARTRLRPIIITTLTTAAGVMPTAYGFGGYVEALAPMVLAIGWGIMFASTLTLFLLPGLYLLQVQLEMKISKKFSWIPMKTKSVTS
ncbi:MAG: efflux RND transporter permease subunit [Deltaproteobacteria bacterium]|nr:efflux RND transporter permease subunit [Deltaproteobacteria bacterium]